MRVLLAGLVGAAASAAAWFFLEYVTKQEFGWLAIAVGIVTGLCVNAAAPAGAAQSYGRAVLAVALTLMAVVGGRMVYAKVMQNMSQVTSVMAAPALDDEEAEVEEVAADGDVEAVEVVELEQVETGRAGVGAGRLQKPTVNDYKEAEVAWMALAALAAYLTGKGTGKPVHATAEPVVVDGTPEGSV